MSMQKRPLPSSSSGQPSQPKRACFPPTDQAWKGSETKIMPCRCLTKEDVRSVVREELERAKSHSAECQCCSGYALEEKVQRMLSTIIEYAVQKLNQPSELANIHSSHLARVNTKSTAKNDARKLRLQLRTKLSLPLFTGMKLEGDGGAHIYVALIDVSTGDVVTTGPESSIKLDVVVLEGDFNKDDEDNWTQEEFENHIVKQREGKRPLLTGDLLVTLKEGVGELGELMFTDNSSWNRSKSFRIGLKVALGYCGNTRIREAKTDAFPVKEHRGESYKKHYPPASDDEIWRLKKIAKDGKFHQKLSEAGIKKVEDFLLQLYTNSKKLREILGKSIIPKNWDILVDHAKTCRIDRKLYLYYSDGMRKHGAGFNTDCQLIGLIKDGVYLATDWLSAQDKERGDTIVKMALDNLNDVGDFNGETFSGSMQKESSSYFPSQVFVGQFGNPTPVQRYLATPILPAPVGPEAPLTNAGFTAEGLNGAMASTLPVPSQNTNSGNSLEISVDGNFHIAAHRPMSTDRLNDLIPPGYHGSTIAGLPTWSYCINLQNAMCSQTIDSLSRMDYTGYDSVLSEGNHVMEDPQLIDSGMVEKLLADSPSCNDTFSKTPLSDNDFVRGTSRGVIGWLKIKAVFQWGFFIRKRGGVRLAELDEPPIAVQARS
ncbi:calmodulin-binding protein 60 D-like [Syzygium oleosum]|uniref:calmodulin-binding protein 60 D-like n=1 Tax=Syzygium oleosum TaxID=219896 RepID=UPI0024B90514|nr:calmodulin-binding protein 60 D-like [Syzygium oleosum]